MAKIDTNKEKIEEILTRNVTFIKPEGKLKEQLESGKKLRIKFGIDPTGNRIHVGRAATLMKLRDFQLMGHKIVIIVGDFTALVGDASDKEKERPMLTKKDVKNNLKNYLSEIGRIINIRACEIRYNSKWLGKLDFNEIAELANNFSIAEMLDRENFSQRFKNGIRISLREFMYPLMQGYDSVAVKSDVELGGNDQLFNILAGRKLQKAFGQKPQSIIGTKLINAFDGTKMSTSIGNCVFIDEEPNEMFGKLMSGRDEEMESYFETLTRVDMDEARKMIKEDPRAAKAWLAREIVGFFHGEEKAKESEENFNALFRDKGKPTDIEEFSVKKGTQILDFIAESKLVSSKSEGRRLILQNGVKVNNVVASDGTYELIDGDEVRVGKRKWAIVKLT